MWCFVCEQGLFIARSSKMYREKKNFLFESIALHSLSRFVSVVMCDVVICHSFRM